MKNIKEIYKIPKEALILMTIKVYLDSYLKILINLLNMKIKNYNEIFYYIFWAIN
jgi:hypothetical protein